MSCFRRTIIAPVSDRRPAEASLTAGGLNLRLWTFLLEQLFRGGGIHDERAEDFQARVGQQRAEGLGACAAANAALAGVQVSVLTIDTSGACW